MQYFKAYETIVGFFKAYETIVNVCPNLTNALSTIREQA